MSIRSQILRVGIPNVRPYGFPPRNSRLLKMGNDNGVLHGHEFDFEVEIQFNSHGIFGRDHTLAFDEGTLAWGEQIRWYAPDPLGANWALQRPADTMDFADANFRVATKTVRVGWFGATRDEPGWFLPWENRPRRDVEEPLVTYANPFPNKWGYPKEGNMPNDTVVSRKFEFAKWLLSHQNGRLVTVLTDRPGLTKKCKNDDGSWQQSGGGGMDTLNRHSRRRVVMFSLSAGGHTATATQILETQGGVSTICKFIIPSITVQESEDPVLLAKWRNELDPADANNFTTAR